jgi:hypothetical protein
VDAPRPRAGLHQEGTWQRVAPPGATAPLVLGCVRLRGLLDPALLERSWNAVVARHEGLRSAYQEEDGRLVQVIAPAVHLPVEVSRHHPDDLPAVTREEVERPIDLEHGPLSRLRLLRFGPEDHALFLKLHHMIGDGRSLEIIVRDLTAYYLAGAAGTTPALPELPVQYADVAQWQRERLAGPRGAELTGYWKARLAGAEPAVLPADRAGPEAPPTPGGVLVLPMPDEVARGIADLARAHRTTAHTVGLAAFTALLARRSGQRDLCVRVPVSYRDRTECLDVVGDFSNDVVVRTDLLGNPSFATLLDQIRDQAASDLSQHELPPHLLEPHLDAPGLLSRLFHVQYTAEDEVPVALPLGVLRAERIAPRHPYVSRPLSLRLRWAEHGGHCVWLYRTARFSAGRIRQLADDYYALLTRMATDGGERVFTAAGVPSG